MFEVRLHLDLLSTVEELKNYGVCQALNFPGEEITQGAAGRGDFFPLSSSASSPICTLNLIASTELGEGKEISDRKKNCSN